MGASHIAFAPPTAWRQIPATPLRCASALHRPVAHKPAPRMAVPPAAPDEYAVDMLTFALSGPGVAAAAAFVLGSGALAFNFFEIGPRRPQASIARPGASSSAATSGAYVRVSLPEPRRYETADAGARTVPSGESVLRFASLEAANAACKQLRAPGVVYTVYRPDGRGGMRTVTDWPREINAADARWPADGLLRDVSATDADAALQARWEEYQLMDANTDLDERWNAFVQTLGGFAVEQAGSECKLCGGSGSIRCFRCGGAARSGRTNTFTCDCVDGRRPCEWCQSGSA